LFYIELARLNGAGRAGLANKEKSEQ